MGAGGLEPVDDPGGVGAGGGANWKGGPREGLGSTGTAIRMPMLQCEGVPQMNQYMPAERGPTLSAPDMYLFNGEL